MTYHSRIPSDPTYIQILGTAFYNFTYLEWVVIWTIVKLSDNGFNSVPNGKSASYIAKALIMAVQSTAPPLSHSLRLRLMNFHQKYLKAISARNKLLHAHPYTAPGGIQQLGGGGREWTTDEIESAALQFEEAAIFGNDIFHGDLAKERP
jgi:hypothetical protein